MRYFRCVQCGSLVSVADDHEGRTIVCSHCQGERVIPDALFSAAEAREAMSVPEYNWVISVAILLMAVGICAIIFFLNVPPGMIKGNELLFLVQSSLPALLCVGMGVVLLLLREIAINSWHVRNK